MTRRIRAIKDEIRVLGLDKCNPRLTVGVIARGGFYLDGVISFAPNPKNSLQEPARRIVDSTYFPELRAVMLHSSNYNQDFHSVERITNLPTIAISKQKPRLAQGYMAFHGDLGNLWVKTKFESTVLKRILIATWTTGKLPEPLRVAHLLAGLEFRGFRDKG